MSQLFLDVVFCPSPKPPIKSNLDAVLQIWLITNVRNYNVSTKKNKFTGIDFLSSALISNIGSRSWEQTRENSMLFP